MTDAAPDVEDQEFEANLHALEKDPDKLAKFLQGAVEILAEEDDPALSELFDGSIVDVPFTCEHFAQQREGDCGVAAAASFCGVPYDQAFVAAKAAGYAPGSKGMTLDQVRATLADLWPTQATETDHDLRPALEAVAFDDDRPRLCLIRKAGSRWGHFVVVECGFVLDSERALPEPITAYHRRTWKLVRSWVTPEESDE